MAEIEVTPHKVLNSPKLGFSINMLDFVALTRASPEVSKTKRVFFLLAISATRT